MSRCWLQKNLTAIVTIKAREETLATGWNKNTKTRQITEG